MGSYNSETKGGAEGVWSIYNIDMTIFATGDYSYRSSTFSTLITLPSSLITPSTCFTSGLSSSTAAYRPSVLRYDRSNSTPLRSMRSESPGNFYNRAVSEFSISSIGRDSPSIVKHKSESDLQKSASSLSDQDTLQKEMKSPVLQMRKISKVSSSNRFSYPMCNKIPRDHVARYSQRITDIFENKEDDEEEEILSYKPFSKYAAIQNKAYSPFVPKSSYKSVLEEAKIIEAKYKKMNDEEEENRPKTEFDHLRPTRNKFSLPTKFEPLSKGQYFPSQSVNNVPTKSCLEEKLCEQTMNFYRDAIAPSQSVRTESESKRIISPRRYLAANLRTDIYNRDSLPPKQDFEAVDSLPAGPSKPCTITRRYTNRETRLARKTLDYIKKGERWTSSVARPFVVGI